MLFNIQVLRAIASLLVVHAHAAAGGLDLAWVGGANGVDLFFVISGFIIAYVASLDADQFMTRRLIRIVPIYWASTLALWALVTVVPQVFRSASPDLGLLVRSLLFVPDPSGPHEDGVPHPTLSGGWTLNYEMYFYVTFWIALAISKRWASVIAVALLVAVMIALRATGLYATSSVAFFYGNPIVFEFVYGIAAFHLVRYATAHRLAALVPRAVLAACVAGGLACLAFNKEIFGSGPRWILSGLPAFVVVTAAVLLERLHAIKVTNRYAVLVGDASYVMYLIHAYVVFGITRLVLGSPRYGEAFGQLVVVGLMAVSVVAGVVIYRYVEQPMLRVLKRKLVKARPRTDAHQVAAP